MKIKIDKSIGCVPKRRNICIHNKRKSRCNECDGSELCKCDNNILLKYNCLQCTPRRFCKHFKKKCVICIVSDSCICGSTLNKYKYSCITCNPGNFCIHKNIRMTCVICANKMEEKTFESYLVGLENEILFKNIMGLDNDYELFKDIITDF